MVEVQASIEEVRKGVGLGSDWVPELVDEELCGFVAYLEARLIPRQAEMNE